MPRVDFYILDATGDEAAGRTACRLAERAWKAGHEVFVRTRSDPLTQWLDDLLWTFRQDSFVPHACTGSDSGSDVTSESAPQEPIMIGAGEIPDNATDVLINLGEDVPLSFAQFARVAEIVTGEDQVRQRGRERFRYYRDQGCEVHSHNL